MFAAYDPNNPRAKIYGFLLNFDPWVVDTGNGGIWMSTVRLQKKDGLDRIFGDNGNDWLVGGTYYDWMFGGWGDDLLNADDYLETNDGLNDRVEDDVRFRQGDLAFGGAGRDVLIANSAQDRLVDWQGDFNTYVVPFAYYGAPVVYRSYTPRLAAFIRALAYAAGTDVSLTPFEPYDEPAIVAAGLQGSRPSPNFVAQTGPPRDPPGNLPGVPRDGFNSTNPDCVCYVRPNGGDGSGGSSTAGPGAGGSWSGGSSGSRPARQAGLAATDGPGLASTGFDGIHLLGFAILLLLVGLVLERPTRRRLKPSGAGNPTKARRWADRAGGRPTASVDAP